MRGFCPHLPAFLLQGNTWRDLPVTTAPREPAWHRRARRARGEARALLRVASGAALIRKHHSAQPEERPSAHMGDGAWKRDAPFLEGLGKDPTWACSGCGRKGNWHKRAFCRCGREPPGHVCREQRRSMDAKSVDRREGRGRSAERRGERRDAQKSYADAARSKGSSSNNGKSKTDSEVEALRKQLANERKEKEALLAKVNKTDEEDEDMDADGDTSEDRDARIDTLTADLQSVGRVCGEASSAYRSAKAELDKLLKERREEKPLRAQLQNSERRIARQKAKVERLSQKSGDLENQIKELQGEQVRLDEEILESVQALGALERERKQLLLREARADDDKTGAQGAVGPRAGGGAAALPVLDDNPAWNHVCAALAARAAQPGADAAVAQQLGTLMQSMAALVQQLGGNPPAQFPLPAAAGGNGLANGATATAGGLTAQPPTVPAAGGDDLQPPPPPQHDGQAHAVQNGSNPTAAGVDGGAAAAGSTFFIGGDGDDAAAGSHSSNVGAGDAGGGNGGADAGGGGEDAHLSGSEAGSDAEDMDIEASMAGIPAEQRGKVREALARRRKQQKSSGKLKKQVDEAVKGVAGDAKKPNKG